ncbi:MAG: MAPEG family protein [Kiloniellales bacterium]|nr:MAPEG family protein [Kiloniellales bacterium]
MTVTPLYAALCGLLLILLSRRVIQQRQRFKVALGDAGEPQIQRAMRVQANFVEYAPIGLVLLALAELQGHAVWLLHGLGLLLICGRLLHAFGVAREPENIRFRVAGMALTFAAIALGSLANLAGVLLLW